MRGCPAPAAAGQALFGLALAYWMPHRRLDAARAAGVLAVAKAAKLVIGEPRPPAALQAFPAGSAASYHSGHSTVAAAITLALLVTAPRPRWRTIAVIGGLYTLGVAASRVSRRPLPA